MTRPYVDTSALAKWFFNEAHSESFESFATSQAGLAISTLSVVEFRCLVARRQRARLIDAESSSRVIDRFEELVRRSSLLVYPLGPSEFESALRLVEQLGLRYGLRTLDALHIAGAMAAGARVFATADSAQGDAATAAGLDVERFH